MGFPPKAGNPAPAAPAPAPKVEGTMAPDAPPAEAQVDAKAVEGLNVAQAGAMEALEAAQAAPQVGQETEAKIEQAVVLLDEAKNEIAAPAPDENNPIATGNTGVLGSGAEL